MANHLIIGLGGTGGKVLREMRKRIYEEFRSNDPGNNVHIDYVYVDSSPTDLNDRAGWKVLGKSVHLGTAQKVNINGISTAVLQNINQFPGLKSFLNQNDINLMLQSMGPLITAGIGGQRRRLGRTLIANNMSDRDNPANFEQIIRTAVGRLQQDKSGDANVTFHICAGLAGGTGSGSIIDVISLIRTWYPFEPGQAGHEDGKYKIRLFLYMPEKTLATVKHDAGFYQANGYAALQELNALSTGHYYPVSIQGEQDLFTHEAKRLLTNQEPFEAAYIYSNENEAGKILDISQSLPAAVADFLFQSIIASNMVANGQMGRLVGCENDGAGAETDLSGQRTRSRKFLTFGITRVEYPETEIQEYVTYNYAIQAARQLSFNYWQEGIGYGECSLDEVGVGFIDEIKKKENRNHLMLSNNHLTLAQPIIPNENNKKWKPIDITWTNRTQADADEVQRTVEKKSWFGEFTVRCKRYYDDEFRRHGVKKFYQLQQSEIRGYSRFIRRHIEKLLFDEWASGAAGSKSILEIEKYVSLLIKDCNDRLGAFNQQKGILEEEQNKITLNIKSITAEWENIGWLRDAITNASNKVFAQYKSALCEYYTVTTRIDAYDYAKLLLQAIIEQLSNMQESILAFRARLTDITREVVEQAGSKCSLSEEQDETNIKKYNPEKVHTLTKQFVANKDYQQQNAAAIRSRLVANLGEDGEHSFANLYETTDYSNTLDIMLDICQESAVHAMEDMAANDPLNRMVSVNILEKLKQELNTEELKEEFVKKIVRQASPYARLNSEETAKVIPGNTGSMMSMVQVCLPRPTGNTQTFYDELIKAFETTIPGFNRKEDVAENYKVNQIVVVAAKSGLPLRYLDNLTVLKDKYDHLVAAPNAELNRMVLHTESFPKTLPSLFELTPDEIEKMVRKPLMLAYALGIISEQQDPVTGQKFDAINIPDEFSDTNWVPLGKDFVATIQTLRQDLQKAQSLVAQVEQELQKQARSNEQKASLREAVGEVVKKRILPSPLCENNTFSTNYAFYRNLAIEIFNNELKEL